MKRIYLSGPMSDLPDNNYPAFNAAAAHLRAEGHHVENPAESARQESWAAYMRVALSQMLTCDEVCLLPGWEKSSGAVWEASIARGLGLPIKQMFGPIGDPQMLGLWALQERLCDAHLIPLPAPGELRRSA